ncbi:MAG: hypothetical protein KIT11_00485 [Fimbriimonadaceae bacterium]|nr:hypothetical protein [Fimbriimonadaceae bacterium]QYK55150.1 MAG: hypothetical protein KF733_09050 [Fimbriimonadaceae bacterium]
MPFTLHENVVRCIAMAGIGLLATGCFVEDSDPDTVINPPAKVEVNPPAQPPDVNVHVEDKTPDVVIEDKTPDPPAGTTGG